MPTTSTSSFKVTSWSPETYDTPREGPELTRVSVGKSFSGSMEGTSLGEGLFCGMGNPADGAGYMVSERFSGTLDGKQGSFVLQHTGIMAPGSEPQASGHIVPGSGTGELKGIRGTVQVGKDHTMTLRYQFAQAVSAE